MDENTERSPNYCNGYRALPRTTAFPPKTHERSSFANKNNAAYAVPKERVYLKEENNVFDMLHFLLAHLIVHQPADPIRYLYRLLDDCILFRAGLKEPRLLWTRRHVDAVFRSSNNSNRADLLSLDDYKTAMEILNVRSYDPCPVQRVPGYVDQLTFCTEASNSMKKELMRMVEVPATRHAPSTF